MHLPDLLSLRRNEIARSREHKIETGGYRVAPRASGPAGAQQKKENRKKSHRAFRSDSIIESLVHGRGEISRGCVISVKAARHKGVDEGGMEGAQKRAESDSARAI